MTRTKAVVGLLIVVALAVPAYAWWRTGENERRLDDLIEMTYAYSGFDGDADLHFLHHGRRKPGSMNCEGLDGDWYGIKAASRSDATIDWFAGAEVAAQRFEAEGGTYTWGRLLVAAGQFVGDEIEQRCHSIGVSRREMGRRE